MRIFQDADCAALNNSYHALLQELKDNDIIGVSIEREVKNRNIVVKIINFPSKYIRPYPNLNGNLYLMDYEKVSLCLKQQIDSVNMSPDIINEDLFLQIMCNKVKISERVFIKIRTADNINEEITRTKRIRIGNLMLQEKYSLSFENKFNLLTEIAEMK